MAPLFLVLVLLTITHRKNFIYWHWIWFFISFIPLLALLIREEKKGLKYFMSAKTQRNIGWLIAGYLFVLYFSFIVSQQNIDITTSILKSSFAWIIPLQLAGYYFYHLWSDKDLSETLNNVSALCLLADASVAIMKTRFPDQPPHYEAIVLSGRLYYARRAYEGREGRRITYAVFQHECEQIKMDLENIGRESAPAIA